MSAVIAVRKTANGKILARRLDGQPLTDADRAEARHLAAHAQEPRAWVVKEYRCGDGELEAVELCSALVGDHLVIVLDGGRFTPPPDAVVYLAEEIAALRDKTPQTVVSAHRVKRVFGGGTVLQ